MEEALLLDLEGGAEDGNGSVSQREGEGEREEVVYVAISGLVYLRVFRQDTQESIRQPFI